MILEKAIKQSHFGSLKHKTALNIYYTHTQLHHLVWTLLKPYRISVQQFNILRILRGQQGKAINVGDITERMIDRMSNTSRLIEKLRNKRLIDRVECLHDRRKAEITITPEGLELVEKTSLIIDAEMSGRMNVLTDEEVQTLNNLLDKLNQS